MFILGLKYKVTKKIFKLDTPFAGLVGELKIRRKVVKVLLLHEFN